MNFRTTHLESVAE